MTSSDIPSDIRLRELRRARGLTLQGLSGRTGLSIGTLSQVERGLSNPSLDALRRLAAALEVAISDIFAPEDPADVAVIRRDDRVRILAPGAGTPYTRLSPGFGAAEILEGRLEAGAASSAEPWAHDAEESIVVLEGRLIVELGTGSIELDEGDCSRFDSRIPHRYRAAEGGPARFLIVVTQRP